MEALLTAHLTELKKQFDLSRRCMARALRDRNRSARGPDFQAPWKSLLRQLCTFNAKKLNKGAQFFSKFYERAIIHVLYLAHVKLQRRRDTIPPLIKSQSYICFRLMRVRIVSHSKAN